MQKSPAGHFLQANEAHFHDYVRVILRRRKIFFLVFSLIFFSVGLYTFTVRPTYEAYATLHVKGEKGGKGDLLSELGVDRQNPVETEIEILKSRSNIEKVVQRLQLDRKVTKVSPGFSFNIVDFAGAVPLKPYRVQLTGPGTYNVYGPSDNLLGGGTNGTLFQMGDLRLLITELKGKPGDSFQLSVIPVPALATSLKGMIRVAEVGNKTSILRLSFIDTRPELARDVVNTLAQVYLEQSVAFKTQEASKSLEFIEEQMNAVRRELDTAEHNLQEYKTSSGVVRLDSEADELVKKIAEIEKDRTALLLQRRQVELSIAGLRDALRRGKIYTPVAGKDDAGIGPLATKLAELEVQKRAILTETTDAHPEVKRIQVQIDEVQQKLLAVYESSLKSLSRQEAGVTQELGRHEGLMKQLPAAEREMARLMRHSKVNADIYTFLLQKHEEARIAKASTISNINIIDPALTPQLPIKPNKNKNLLLGFLLALMAGVGVAFFLEYLDDTVKDAESAQRELGLPILAVIPFIHSRTSAELTAREHSLVTVVEPKGSAAEAFRSLRTSIHFSAVNHDRKVIVGTSSFPAEGKSTIMANLAITMVQAGRRVLIIDCDMRRPSMHEFFGHVKVPGLADLLAGDAIVDQVIKAAEMEGLYLITAGTTPPNPSELLGSEQMAAMIASLKEQFDHILLDAPPVLAVTDAPLLAVQSDMVVMIMEAGRVPVKAAHRMVEMLMNVKAPLVGLVLNDKSRRGEAYGYYRSYYGYGYDYEQEEQEPLKKTVWRKLLKM